MGPLNHDAPPTSPEGPVGISEGDRARTYSAALGLLFDATCVISPELIVLECDEGFARLLDRPGEDVTRQPLPTLHLTGSVEGQPVTLRHVARTGSWRGHATLTREDGSALPVDTLLIKSTAEEPRIHLFLRDLRGPLSVQVGEVDHQHALAQVSRLSALGEMTSGIAHEMNQPLAAIVNYANGCISLIKQGRAEDPAITGALSSIAEQSSRAAEIIRRMRAFARRSGGQRGVFRLTELIREALEVSASQRRRVGVELQCDLDELHDEIVADGIQIEQVLLHLLRNAMDSLATVPGDTPRIILVRTRHTPGDGEGPGAIETTITDSGPPIPSDEEMRLFAPFATSRENGLGLGLVISRSIIEANGGKLTYLGCSDAPPGGPAFCFTLPLRAAQI